jgi:hypothetical protein
MEEKKAPEEEWEAVIEEQKAENLRLREALAGEVKWLLRLSGELSDTFLSKTAQERAALLQEQARSDEGKEQQE